MAGCGPWYECQGPNAEYVRENQYNKYAMFINNKIGFKSYRLMSILLNIFLIL